MCKRSVLLTESECGRIWLLARHFCPRTNGRCRGGGFPVRLITEDESSEFPQPKETAYAGHV